MKEVGMLNGHIDSALTRQGHCDLLIVADAGFPCPDHVEVIDIALREGVPTVLEVLAELRKVHSVEKIVMANETRDHSPTHFKKASQAFGKGVEVEAVQCESGAHFFFSTSSRVRKACSKAARTASSPWSAPTEWPPSRYS